MNNLLSLVFWTLFIFQTNPTITFPHEGDALQGLVTIVGSNQMVGFVSSEISFAYSGSSTGTWFLIAKSDQIVQNGNLGEWDTSLISDGNYDLRLRTFLNDGTYYDNEITGLRIRNYTSVETPLPTISTNLGSRITDTPKHNAVPTTSRSVTHNPLELTNHRLLFVLGIGILIPITLFLFLSLYLKLRWK